MHVLFVHRNFPAQFGHLAARLSAEYGWRCTFVSEKPPAETDGVTNIQYRPRGGATQSTHYASRTFENGVWHAAGVYEALQPASALVRPDVIVGHSGFGSTLFLHRLFKGVPVVNYLEWFYKDEGTDIDFRPDYPPPEADRLRAPARNAMILLDLEYCAAGYTPTRWQHSQLPAVYADKVQILHDGVDTGFWRRRPPAGRVLGDLRLGPQTRLVTYVSRGLEPLRGFDVFLRAAKLICDEYEDVRVVIVGDERIAYGAPFTDPEGGNRSFRDWVTAQVRPDPQRVLFAGAVPPETLAQLLGMSDVHVYLTAPFVLSWSLLDAMACECVVVGSDTAPVREVIRDGENGFLRDFFDAEGIAECALAALRDQESVEPVRRAARQTVLDSYSLDRTLPAFRDLLQGVAERAKAG